MAEKDDGGGELNESVKVLRMIFVAQDQTLNVLKPCEHALDPPPLFIASHASSVVGSRPCASGSVGCQQDHVLLAMDFRSLSLSYALSATT